MIDFTFAPKFIFKLLDWMLGFFKEKKNRQVATCYLHEELLICKEKLTNLKNSKSTPKLSYGWKREL